jgi:hypothetical protein
LGVEVSQRVLTSPTEKTRRNVVCGDMILVTYASGCRKSILYQAKMMEKNALREIFNSLEVFRNCCKGISCGRGVGLILGDEGCNLVSRVFGRLIKKNIIHNRMVHSRAG